ncbi:MAG: pyridoxine 5'-phosphate synthase [Elusimicrobia bacterium]|nr:pyridoxine 5'-phosphate synthase [Elusimicrobiota bacterium]
MAVKLGVNIDHVATLRQARKSVDPDPVAAAKVATTSGAEMIVCHLRQDRRHIQDADLFKLRHEVKTQLHLEMADVPEMVAIALKAKPDSVCIVPETAREVTTLGGLNVRGASQAGLCTTAYAAATGKLRQNAELEKLELAGYLAHELGLELHAGHDLGYHNAAPVARIAHMACLNIGFAIMARALFTGLRPAVSEMHKLIAGAR